MEPRIEIVKPKKLIGIHMEMSLSNNKTGELWQKFMQRRAEVRNRMTTDYISMQKYCENKIFTPAMLFEKWATVEVSSFSSVPSHIVIHRAQNKW